MTHAGFNALLNTTSAVFLLSGWVLIRQSRKRAHKRAMIAAFSVSCVFLVSYLVYHATNEPTRFQGTGAIRVMYFTILLTHTVLAALVPPMAVFSLVRGLQGRFDKHRRIARWTLPIWLYVSVTGVVVYWMLYRL
jgi:uncharacterized membrane protein YozB (DUF420 family)